MPCVAQFGQNFLYNTRHHLIIHIGDMPSLALIAQEAERLIRPLEETELQEMRDALIELCENHWKGLRGVQPNSPLERVLWSIFPPLSDLLLDLYALGDNRLYEVMPGGNLAKGLALIVLAEIDRGNEAGVHIAHEPMMAYEAALPHSQWLARIISLLRGTRDAPVFHLHSHRDSMWKALAVITVHTRRVDLPAVLAVISLLSETPLPQSNSNDMTLNKLNESVFEVGVRFTGVDADNVFFELHGHSHKPVRTRQIGELLFEIRSLWLR